MSSYRSDSGCRTQRTGLRSLLENWRLVGEPALCLTFGHVGCCDDSPGKHATQHFRETGHSVIQLGIEGDEALWCYLDQVSFSQP